MVKTENMFIILFALIMKLFVFNTLSHDDNYKLFQKQYIYI